MCTEVKAVRDAVGMLFCIKKVNMQSIYFCICIRVAQSLETIYTGENSMNISPSLRL